MQYVAGSKRTTKSETEFEDALPRYGITCVVVLHAAPWRAEIEAALAQRGWVKIGGGAYDTWVVNRYVER